MPLDVLLVNPNVVRPAVGPISLDYLADSLEARGHKVRLLDLCWESSHPDAIARAVAEVRPDLVGLTVRNTDDCYFASQASFIPSHRKVYQLLRAATSAPIVLGGVGFSIMPDGVLRRLGADLGIVGDGEWALTKLSDRLAEGRDWAATPGLIWLDADGGSHLNVPAPPPVDSLPARRRRLVDNPRYLLDGGQGNLETKRGCAQRCVYCADPVAKGRRFRLRAPDLVADETEALVSQGVDCLHLCDAEFNFPVFHALAVCEELAERRLGERVRWYAYCSAAPFDTDLATAMSRAGCVGVNFGVDSGSAAQLRRLGRHYGPEEVRQTARVCREQGLACMFDLLIGGPGETARTLRETFDLMRSVGPDRVGASVGVRIYPRTGLAEIVRSQGFAPGNPNLHGRIDGNEDLVEPVFYLSGDLGPDPIDLVRTMAAGDDRFLVGGKPGELGPNYNYNDNVPLVEAIRRGERGAYWDILRRAESRPS